MQVSTNHAHSDSFSHKITKQSQCKQKHPVINHHNCDSVSNRPRWSFPHLAEVHDDALMNLLPQVSPEDLDQGDLQRRNLTVHEDPCQVQLHLKADIHLQIEEQKIYH